MNTYLRSALLSVTIVAALTVLNRYLLTPYTFYLLYPGNILSLIITGGHGGTTIEEWVGLIAGFLLNAIAYFALILMIHKVIFARTDRREM